MHNTHRTGHLHFEAQLLGAIRITQACCGIRLLNQADERHTAAFQQGGRGRGGQYRRRGIGHRPHLDLGRSHRDLRRTIGLGGHGMPIETDAAGLIRGWHEPQIREIGTAEADHTLRRRHRHPGCAGGAHHLRPGRQTMQLKLQGFRTIRVAQCCSLHQLLQGEWGVFQRGGWAQPQHRCIGHRFHIQRHAGESRTQQAPITLELADQHLKVGGTAPIHTGNQLQPAAIGLQISPGEQPISTRILNT